MIIHPIVASLVIAIGVLDAIWTLRGLMRGTAIETNPVMLWLMRHTGSAWVAIKIFVSFGLGLAIFFAASDIVTAAGVAVFIAYAFVQRGNYIAAFRKKG
jgi:hypothetical protein